MAAILCDGVGKMCTALCQGVSTLCCLPCKICNCTMVSIWEIVSGDFSCYLITTGVTNAIPVALMLATAAKVAMGSCEEEEYTKYYIVWPLVNAALCVSNIAAALYIAKQIKDMKRPKQPSADPDIPVNTGLGSDPNLIPMAHAEVIEEGMAGYTDKRDMMEPDLNTKANNDRNKFSLNGIKDNVTGFVKKHTQTSIPQAPLPSAPPLQPSPLSQPQPQTTTVTQSHNNNNSSTDDDSPGAGTVGRVRDVLCYDPWVAVYLLLLTLFTVWQFVGVFHNVNALFGETEGDCHSTAKQYVFFSTVCGFLFLLFGPVFFFFSLCCVTSRTNFRLR